MASENQPWVQANPGDLITAEDWNSMQTKAQQALTDCKTELEGEIQTVDDKLESVDAVKFGGKTPQEWADQFAPRIHDHEGKTSYRRYIKRFYAEGERNEVLLHHNLGRFPLVDIYRLDDVATIDNQPCKILFYYGHADSDKYELYVQVYRERVPLGIPFEQALAEDGVEYEDDDTIEDVLNDLWDALGKDPNDEIGHCTTEWVNKCCGERRTVRNLKIADQWNDLRLAIRPLKAEPENANVGVMHVNYDTLYIKVGPDLFGKADDNKRQAPVDLMFLLRS